MTCSKKPHHHAGIKYDKILAQSAHAGELGLMMNRSAAIPDYTEAIRLDPNCAEAYKDRGWAYHDRDQYDKAIENYTVAISLDPAYCAAYNLRGLAYDSKAEYDRAIRDYDQGLPRSGYPGTMGTNVTYQP